MKALSSIWVLWLSVLFFFSSNASASATDDTARLAELDKFWNEVQAAVHPSGVLVSGTKMTSYPLSKALARWKQGFLDTRDGKMKAGVEFRFSQRLGDETTAHETGIFHYWTVDASGVRKDDYIHFESLLLKETHWQTLMEYQKGPASESDWEKLKR